ncbi:MAG: hypothetical protein WC682_01550 [Parcubacteria group bacterium]|jgi:hypothetical protein
MNKKYLVIIGVIFLITIGVFIFNLEKRKNVSPIDKIDGVAVAENSATLISQKNNNFKIRLNFKGEENVAKSITRYYVSLYPADDNGDALGLSPVDVAKYDDEIFLGNGNNSAKREILYIAPSFLKGKYAITVNYVNEVGISKKNIKLGGYDLNGSNRNFVEVFSGTCKFNIVGETDNKKYTLSQGVDVKNSEDLRVTCSVMSHFAEDVSVMPSFANLRRKNLYPREEVAQEDKNLEFITLKPNELKDVSFSVPKALAPQAYDAVLFFLDEQRHIISTKAFLHYVLAGESANIERLTLDKNDYKLGDHANVNLSYFGSADGFADSRLGGTKNTKLIFELDLRDNNDVSCLSMTKFFEVNPSDSNVSNFVLDVEKECKNPFVRAVIRGENGNILEEETFLR